MNARKLIFFLNHAIRKYIYHIHISTARAILGADLRNLFAAQFSSLFFSVRDLEIRYQSFVLYFFISRLTSLTTYTWKLFANGRSSPTATYRTRNVRNACVKRLRRSSRGGNREIILEDRSSGQLLCRPCCTVIR